MNFNVSVVIPAYNAEKFVDIAILSALEQSEVTEVLVINDGSTDNTLKKIQSIKTNNERVKLLSHENLINKGRSASRNLGISNAKENYIAFLDADDYYLENRFKIDKNTFLENPEVDGIYNAIGVHFYREFENSEKEKLKLTTLSKKVKPEDLFETLIKGKDGHFSIDGLTVKRSVFDKIGMFNESLKIGEDTDLIWKMSLKCKLKPGILDMPVAKRGIHCNNVFNNFKLYENYEPKIYESIYYWSIKNKLSKRIVERFLERIWILQFRKNKGLIADIKYWFLLFLRKPSGLFSFLSIKYFPIIRLRKKLLPFLYKS